MENNIKEDGIRTKCMEKANLYGQMANSFQAISKEILKKAKASFNGQMAKNYMEYGNKIYNKEQEFIKIKMAPYKLGTGLKEKESSGYLKKKLNKPLMLYKTYK